jgi:hypothetical protein
LLSLFRIEMKDQIDPTTRQRFVGYPLALTAQRFADPYNRLVLHEHCSLPLAANTRLAPSCSFSG